MLIFSKGYINVGTILLIIILGVAGGFTWQHLFWEDASLSQEKERVDDRIVRLLNVTEGEHIQGSGEAAVLVVEYADPECQYCKRLHDTLEEVLSPYIESGEVAFVYRHRILGKWDRSLSEAIALECSALLGSNETFFEFLEKVYQHTRSENTLDLTLLPVFATDLGISFEEFTECTQGPRAKSLVQADQESALILGVTSVPHTFVFNKESGVRYEMTGNKSSQVLRELIELSLATDEQEL